MRNKIVIRVMLSLLLLGAGGARAREIPVYREYTRSVQFYDDRGAVISEDRQQGPDQVRLQSMRDAKAQEAYLGKEMLLDLGFESGESVFSAKRPATAVMVPSSSGDSGRRQKKESGQNWLAGSLALPSLGQSSSNAAVSTMSAGAPGSGWGWLADEVSGQSDDASALAEDLLAEEKMNLGLIQEDSRRGTDPANPYSTRPVESSSDFKDADARKTAGSFSDDERSGTFRGDERTGTEVTGASVDRTRAPAPEWGSSRTEASTMKDYSAPAGMADMSQTRAMISDWSAGARPDFSSVATVEARDNRAGGMDRPSSGFSARSWDAGSRSWGRGSRSLESSSAGGGGSVKAPSWKAGWTARQQESRPLSPFKRVSDPTVIPVVPSSTVDWSDPSRSSGGFKPAWF